MFLGGGGGRGSGYFPVGLFTLTSCKGAHRAIVTADGRAEVKAVFWSQMSFAVFPE